MGLATGLLAHGIAHLRYFLRLHWNVSHYDSGCAWDLNRSVDSRYN